MTERDKQCFQELGGRWGDEHSKVLQWADSHPLSHWKDPKVDGMPVEEGEYLVVIKSRGSDSTWLEICYHEKNKKTLTAWDGYDDTVCTYYKKDVKFWMKIPDYK